MLSHFLLFFYVLAFAVGFATILFSVLFFLKERNQWIKYYLVLLVSFTVLLVIYTFQLYNIINTQVSSTVLYLFIYINLGVLVYLIPLALTKFIRRSWGKLHNLIFISLVAAYLVMMILSFALQHNIVFYAVMNGIFYASMGYSLIVAAVSLKKIEQRSFKVITGIYILLSCIFIPFFFFETFISRIFPNLKGEAYHMWALPLYYFWWNVLVLGYLVNYFYNIRRGEYGRISDEFIQQHRITKQEQKIIGLILRGRSNRYIAQDLHISVSTVNNHVANIFEKTGYHSRFELITLINTSSKNT